jgi:trk system potassium uptake protein TrkA
MWRTLSRLISPNIQPGTTRRRNSLKQHHNEFIIVGMGRFGTGLAMTLSAYGHDVLVIDSDLKRVQQMSQLLPHVIQLDATDVDALREVGVEAFDTGVVCIGTDFESNLLATVNLRKLGVRRVITKARTVTQQDVLLKIGADEVILPEHEAGVRLGRKLAAVDFVDFMDLTEDTGVVEIITPAQFVGQSLRETEMRQRFGLTVVAIRRDDNVIISPGAGEVIEQDDILVVLGRTVDCERLR